MDLSSFQHPTLAPTVTSIKTFKYTPGSKHIYAEVLAGPYDDNGVVVLREYSFTFTDIVCVHFSICAAPWLSLLKMHTEFEGNVILQFEEGLIEIQAKSFIASHTTTIPYGGNGKFTPVTDQ